MQDRAGPAKSASRSLVLILAVPLIGLVLGLVFIAIASHIVHRSKLPPTAVNDWSRRGQIIITSLLFSAG